MKKPVPVLLLILFRIGESGVGANPPRPIDDHRKLGQRMPETVTSGVPLKKGLWAEPYQVRWHQRLKPEHQNCLPLSQINVLGLGMGLVHGASQEGADRLGVGIFVEYGKAHGPAGEVVDDHGDPVGEGPALGQAEREPGGPEAQLGRNQSEIHMPDMVDPLGRDHPLSCLRERFGRCRHLGRRGRSLLFRL